MPTGLCGSVPLIRLASTPIFALGFVRARERRYDDAAASFTKAVQINPRFSSLCAFQVAALAMADRTDESRSAAKRLLELEPKFRIMPLIEYATFTRPEITQYLLEGLRKVDLPE